MSFKITKIKFVIVIYSYRYKVGISTYWYTCTNLVTSIFVLNPIENKF